MNLVFAAATCVVGFNGGRVNLSEDDAWDADDPFVKARPEFFRDRPKNVFGAAGRVAAPVEQASAAPGEKRTTRRG